MKKYLIAATTVGLLVLATSCSSIKHTSTVIPVETELTSKSTADLSVSQKKISFTFKPSKAVRRCGEKAVIKTAVAEALKANGNADVLVGFEYEIKKTRNFFGKNNIKYVTVIGYPATYTNIKPIN